ncbi:MAG: Na/Pi cotransporter family protein [Bacteroidales bacterium]|nr:Na/Pi cotransporter family protein [Bacteroidales bacterium]
MNSPLLIVFKLLGSIALLMYGMKVMSEALQKMAGPQLRHVLGAMTTNRFTGVLTGMLVCVSVQSSAATTVMTVSFVNAALLTLAQAISVIMGANIGTTLSAWIMSAGFSFNIANLVWPVFLIAVILIQFKKHRYLGDFLFGISFMFFALGTLSTTGREMDLANNERIINFFSSFDSGSYLTILMFLLIGTILTCIAQSSAALMAITMVLCTSGVLNIYQGIALVMGENIGTTLTANLAALSANTQARRAALAHLVFNVFGVLWVLCVFYPFVRTACRIVGVDADAEIQSPERLTFVLATFHTMFNVTNTMILIWFVPQIEKLVSKLIPHKAADDEFRLQFIQSGIMKTPEISVFQAQKETEVFADRMIRMFEMVEELTSVQDADSFKQLKERIAKYEQISDNMENEIGKYLGQVSNAHLSDDTKQKIRAMLREISELESIGDSCYNLARTLERRRAQEVRLTENQEDGLKEIYGRLKKGMEQMALVLKGTGSAEESARLEHELNLCRDRLRDQNIHAVDNHEYSFATSTIYMDLVAECEKCGDYVVNVVEAKTGSELDDSPDIPGEQDSGI